MREKPGRPQSAGLRRASAWPLRTRLLRVTTVGNEHPQHDEQIGRASLRAKVNEAAQIGENHIPNRATKSEPALRSEPREVLFMAALDLKEGGQQRLGLHCRMAHGTQSLDQLALPLDVRLDVPDMAGRHFEKRFAAP